MKIAIVGAGPAGLSAYLFLRAHIPPSLAPDIQIYESHTHHEPQGATPIGGALGVAPNGMRMLHRLDAELYDTVRAKGYVVDGFRLKSARGPELMKFSAAWEGEGTVMITREDLNEALRAKVPGEHIHDGIRVVRVSVRHGGKGKAVVEFEDGRRVEADLVIGADGSKSVVKRFVCGDGEVDPFPATYAGLSGVGGFIPASLLPSPDGTSSMIFGPNGFFGYTALSSSLVTASGSKYAEYGPRAGWWSTYETKEAPERGHFDAVEVLDQLKSRHGKWNEPIVRGIIASVERLDNVWPTWITPQLPEWSKERVVLVGDAAHALHSTSGQGISQALEDSCTLALLLEHYLSSSPMPMGVNVAISKATTQYTTLRKPRVDRIAERAAQMADNKHDKGMIGEYVMYFAIWVMGKLPWWLIGDWSEAVYGWDVERQVKSVVEVEETERGDIEEGAERSKL